MITSQYVYIPVSNFENAAQWYKKIFGFKVVHKDSAYYELNTSNGIRIMLLKNDIPINSHMNFSYGLQPAYGFVVDDINHTRERLVESQVEVEELINYFGLSFCFYDLDGNKIEIWSDCLLKTT